MYRLYPTKRQRRLLRQTLERCCWLYNETLAHRKNSWKQNKQSVSLYDTNKLLPYWKSKYPELGSVYAQVLQNVQMRVDLSFKAFFRRLKAGETPGYPRFKGYSRYDSFTYPQHGFNLKNGELQLSKIGSLKIKLHRPIAGMIKTLTIRRTASGEWFACFSCECEPEPLPENTDAVGIDVGLASFATLVYAHGLTTSVSCDIIESCHTKIGKPVVPTCEPITLRIGSALSHKSGNITRTTKTSTKSVRPNIAAKTASLSEPIIENGLLPTKTGSQSIERSDSLTDDSCLPSVVHESGPKSRAMPLAPQPQKKLQRRMMDTAKTPHVEYPNLTASDDCTSTTTIKQDTFEDGSVQGVIPPSDSPTIRSSGYKDSSHTYQRNEYVCEKIANPRFFRKDEHDLARAQRKLSKATTGTPEYAKYKHVIAQIHKRIANRRKNFAHQQSRQIVSRFGIICVEDLTVNRMVHNHCLAKSILDAAWSQFSGFLSYKAANADRKFLPVNPAYTSQDCCLCGHRQVMPLNERTYRCPCCGNVMPRDENTACNIKARGLASLGIHPLEACDVQSWE